MKSYKTYQAAVAQKRFSSQFSLAIMTTLLVVIFAAVTAMAQTTTFTYQGRFTDGGTAANGIYDMQFKLFDSPTVGAGNQIGTTITNPSVTMSDGVFTVQLDFGAAAFPGADRYVEIGVRSSGSSSAYTVLSPRQQLTSSVYAIKARSATTADNATQLGGATANQYVQTTDPRLSDPRSPTPGSANYIQNSTSQQASSNFNISGNGIVSGVLVADRVTAVSEYDLGNTRALSIKGTGNIFAGAGTGLSNSGDNNSFFGSAAGNANTTGDSNSFFGSAAGTANTTGFDNSLFGTSAGTANKTGAHNSIFGSKAGLKNASSNNSFFGFNSGSNNTTGEFNSFFGEGAGQTNITGSSNAFFGDTAGGANTSGAGNTFIGSNAAGSHIFGDRNTALGFNTFVNNGITNATAIGANAFVDTSNTMVLGTDTVAVVIPGQLYVKKEVAFFPAAGGNASICRNASSQLALCSSSLRYKKDLQPFTRGLTLLNQLKPITFKWKSDNSADLGFGAEDVAAVEPLLVTHNDKGQVEGVKYDRITAVLVNAVKEQQGQIERQQSELTIQQKQIATLKILVCRHHSRASACK